MSLEPVKLSDPEDHRIAPFRSLRKSPQDFNQQGTIVVEGLQVFNKLLGTELEIRTVLIEDKLFSELAPVLDPARFAQTQWYTADRKVLSSIVGFHYRQGLAAIADKPEPVLLADCSFPAVALDGLADAENVGSIIRSAAAFGVRTLIVDGSSADPYLRRSIRVSMGAIFSIAVIYAEDLAAALKAIRNRAEVIAIENGPGSGDLFQHELPDASVFIFGNERGGISNAVLEAADRIFHIPTATELNGSLNVSAAAAISLAHAFRSQQVRAHGS